MLHKSPYTDVVVPVCDVSSHVLERAERLGDKPALIDGESHEVLTYRGLIDAVRQLAAGLQAYGVQKGDVVAIWMPNRPEYAVIFHGACRAGATVTTINPQYTVEESAKQLRDARAKLIFTVPSLLEKAERAIREADVKTIVSIGPATNSHMSLGEMSALGVDCPEIDIDPDHDLASLPYSSGTTGLPKGVMLTHRNLVANLCQAESVFDVDQEDVSIAALPFFHIYGMTVIMNLGLRAGATTITMPAFDLTTFLDLIETYRATRLWVVPPIALALAKHPSVGDRDLTSIRHILSGAAPLGAELEEAVAKRLGCAVGQGYGMTEASPLTHTNPVDPAKIRRGTIGVPVANVECRIVDPIDGRDVGADEPGELWIRGPNIMKGYLNNDEATSTTIVQGNWLRTGDVAVVDDDGYYRVVDRIKDLIKYKGFQVAPAELEAILLAHPAVSDAAVVGVPDDKAGEIPKAFIVADADDASDEEILQYVADRVAPYKRIRLIERLAQVPKSASGKILRRVLAENEGKDSAL